MIAFLWWTAFVLWATGLLGFVLIALSDERPEHPLAALALLIGGALALAATWSLA